MQLAAQEENHSTALQSTREKLQNMLNDQKQAFESQLAAMSASKEHELALAQSELLKQTQECEKLAASLARLQLEKHSLEQEVNSLGEQRTQMGKYDWQMNEILAMLADEKQVRGHLRALAGKLIEEVDALKMQTSATAASATGPQLNGSHNAQSILASSINGPNSHVLLSLISLTI